MEGSTEQEDPDDGAARPAVDFRAVAKRQLAQWYAERLDHGIYNMLQGISWEDEKCIKRLETLVKDSLRIGHSPTMSSYAPIIPPHELKCCVCEGEKEIDSPNIRLAIHGNGPIYSFSVCKICYMTAKIAGCKTALEINQHRKKQNASI